MYVQGSSGPFRPANWKSKDTLTITATETTQSEEGEPVNTAVAYVFDGVLHADHYQQSVITLNPVQTGAPIADHAYTMPQRLTVELLMSDAMQSYYITQWQDGPTRSYSAYQKLLSLQQQRTPLQVATRMNQYDRMLVTEVRAAESAETKYGGKFYVTFTQILTAQIEISQSGTADSAIPQTTVQTTVGQVATVPPSAATQALNYTPLATPVPAAGQWSSLPGLGALPAR
jgi:hypothetical protein